MQTHNIIDSLSVNDNCDHNVSPIKGRISITDKNGNEIVHAYNMVVDGGRKLVRDLLYSAIDSAMTQVLTSPNTIYEDHFIKNPISAFKAYKSYGDDSTATVRSMTLRDIKGSPSDIEIKIEPSDGYEGIQIILSGTITGEIMFNQIYLTYVTYDKEKMEAIENLFSRVAIDPVYLAADSSYNFKYILYF